jgi:hypothetical protein
MISASFTSAQPVNAVSSEARRTHAAEALALLVPDSLGSPEPGNGRIATVLTSTTAGGSVQCAKPITALARPGSAPSSALPWPRSATGRPTPSTARP